jgi:hypothetical protein
MVPPTSKLLPSQFNCIGYLMSNEWMIVNVELGRMWTEAVMVSFKALSQNLVGGNEGN